MTTAAFLLGAILGIIAGLALAERVWKYALVTRFFKNFEVRADSSSPLLARNERPGEGRKNQHHSAHP